MKREQLWSSLVGAVLAFLLSFGGVGCLVTGFRLDASLSGLVLACGIFALGSGACFLLKRGGMIIACLFALAGGFLWRSGSLVGSFSSLFYEISRLYDSAYGWGPLGTSIAPTDTAVWIIGSLIAVCVSWTVSRRKSAIPAVTVSLLPLLCCLVVTDTVPSEGYLYLLILGLLVLMLTNNLRRIAPGQANTLAAMVALPVAAALGGLFLLAPQDSYVNHSEEFQNQVLQWIEDFPQMMEDLSENVMSEVDGTIQPQSVDLANQGPRNLYTYPVMDVIAAQSGTLYLREQDYDSYDGTGWTATARREEALQRNEKLDWVSLGVVTISTRRSRSQLFVPYYPGDTVPLQGGSAENTESDTVYEILQYGLPAGWQSLDLGSGSVHRRYLELPQETEAWAQALLEDILSGGETATEKAQAIAAYVRNSAEYDLNTGKMSASAKDFTIWFLEESDTGYCVHFATATAVLLRAADVPSRYVTGYMTQGIKGHKVTVTADQAHAWVEYYEPNLDTWIVLESTPADGTSQPDPETKPGETETISPAETVTDTTSQTETPTGAGEETAPATVGSKEEPEKIHIDLSWLRTLALWACIPAAVIGGIAAQRSIRLKLRRRRMDKGSPNARALAMWQEALLYGKLLKQPVPRYLDQLAQKAKYSQHTLRQQELAEFEKYLRAARSQCKADPWYLQALYKWLLALY